MTIKIPTKPYNDNALIKKLRKNPKELKIYLKNIIKLYEQDKDLDVFLDCLKVAIMANRGLATKIAKNSSTERTAIYKALSNNTRPRIDTFINILNGLNISWSFNLL